MQAAIWPSLQNTYSSFNLLNEIIDNCFIVLLFYFFYSHIWSTGPIGSALCVYRADNSMDNNQMNNIFNIFKKDLRDSESVVGSEVPNEFVEVCTSIASIIEYVC